MTCAVLSYYGPAFGLDPERNTLADLGRAVSALRTREGLLLFDPEELVDVICSQLKGPDVKVFLCETPDS
jgi:hypothetical protein